MKPKITLVYPYYNNPLMFVEQQRIWSEYPQAVRDAVEMIVTDDCSPREPAIRYVMNPRNFRLRLYRIGVDIRWNWLAAKNLGAYQAEGEWLLLTDIDHVVPVETIEYLLDCIELGTVSYKKYYTFDRVDAPGLTPYKIHPNSYFMTKKGFWRVGGYDEDFSGYYGTDGYFRACVNRIFKKDGEVHLGGVNLIRYSREVICDASTTDFQRKTELDKSREKKDKMKRKLENGLPPKSLTFPWEQVL